MPVYLLKDGRQLVDKSLVKNEEYIEIGEFLFPYTINGDVFDVVGIENGKPKYEKVYSAPVPEPTIDEKIYEAVSKSQDEIRQEGADMVMEELVKRGMIV